MWFLLVVFITAVRGCTTPCSCELGVVVCQGRDITSFPEFDEDTRLSAVHMYIDNTRLKNLPYLKAWPSLRVLDVRNNPNLHCQELVKAHKERPDLDIHSDCYLSYKESYLKPWLIVLEVQTGILGFLCFLYGVWKGVKLRRQRRQSLSPEVPDEITMN